MNKFKPICDEIDFWHFEDEHDFMVYSDGSLGVGFKIQGQDIDCKTEAEINAFNRSIENLLLGMEDGLKFQVFYRLTSNVRRLIEKHEAISKDAPEIYRPIVKARIKDFEKNLRNQEYFVPEIYLFLRSKPLKYKKRGLLDKKVVFESANKKAYETHIKKFNRSATKLEASLSSMGLNPVQLLGQNWFDLCFEFLNFSRVKNVGHAEFQNEMNPLTPSLAAQLALSDITTYKDHLKIGRYLFQTITLKTPPEGFSYSAMVDEFTKLPFHFWLSQNVEILSQSKEQENLNLKRRLANSMAAGSKNMSDIESESKLNDIEDLITELVEGSEKLVNSNFTVIIWADNKDTLNERADEVLRAFRELNQAEAIAETLPCFDVFINSIPGLCKGMRNLKLKSSNVSHLMPLYAPWLGGDTPVCLIPTRDNSLFSYAPFEKSLPAWNALTFGPTGTGKSFNVSTQMLSFYGQSFLSKGIKVPPKIVWIDNGASSQRLLEVLGGEFVDLNINSGIRINVFDLKEGEELSPEKVKVVLAVLELILKDEEKMGLPKREKALLEKVIYDTYKTKKNKVPVMSDLKKALDNHKDEEIRKYGEILYSWCGDTAYGRMLDGKSNINLQNDLITIEVEGLTNHPDLKDIFLLLLTSQFQEEAKRELSRPYLLIVDEAERLLKTEMAKQFVITCYRTWRKYNAGIHCLSQNYRDFMSDPALRDAILPNSTSVSILKQKKIDWNHFQEVFDFNDAQIEAIKSLEVVKGSHSEFVLIQDETMMILKLVPEPLAYWICTSDGNDKARIAEEEEKFTELSKIQILERLAFPDEFKPKKAA